MVQCSTAAPKSGSAWGATGTPVPVLYLGVSRLPCQGAEEALQGELVEVGALESVRPRQALQHVHPGLPQPLLEKGFPFPLRALQAEAQVERAAGEVVQRGQVPQDPLQVGLQVGLLVVGDIQGHQHVEGARSCGAEHGDPTGLRGIPAERAGARHLPRGRARPTVGHLPGHRDVLTHPPAGSGPLRLRG